MFKRLKTSLTNPPQTVLFIKDSWWRIVGYILLVPFLLTLPLILRSFVTDSMPDSKYQALVTIIQEDFRSDQIIITEGILTASESIIAEFDYLTLVVGRENLSTTAINILFEEEDLVMILSNVEVSRVSYVELELLNHDFSSGDSNDVKTLAFAVKRYIESQNIIFMTDFMQTYFFGLFDFIFYILMLSLLSMLFISRARIPMKYRFKLSVYLTTVVIVLTMVSMLFSTDLGFLTFFAGYIYHIWAYRSIKIIDTGGI